MRGRAGAGLVVLSLLCVCGRAWAAPRSAYGFGARSAALGGAVTADAGDAASLFYNPALLSLAPESQLLIGYAGTSSALRLNQVQSELPGRSSVDAAALGRGAFLGIPVGFGLGLSLTNGQLSRVETLRADQPRWVLREPLPELVELSAALALRPAPWLALGAGSGFLATTRGSFAVSGTAQLADGKGSEYDSELRHAVDAELLTTRYLLFGAALSLPSLALSGAPVDLRLGLSFRDEAKLEQALHGALSGSVDAGFFQLPVRYTFDARSLVAFQPRQLVLGVSATRADLRLNVDIGFEQWSRYPSPVARSATHVEADVPAGLPLALPPSNELPAPQSAGFSNRFTGRAGLERKLTLSAASRLSLRAGYAYLPSPAPRSADAARLIDASEHVFSLGIGLAIEAAARYLPQRIELDAYALYAHLPNRHAVLRGETFDAKGHILSAGLTLTLSFAQH
jgi:hypothetical protein